MTPTGVLKQEHEHIIMMLKVMNRICSLIQDGERVRPDDLSSIIDFLRMFADRCHHAKEEKLLFPALERVGVLRDSGPIGIMLYEHEQGRSLVRSMDDSVRRFAGGEVTQESAIVANASRYSDLLSGHMAKEESVLFTMADQRLNETEKKDILAGFDEIERKEAGEGTHGKYHALLQGLIERYLR